MDYEALMRQSPVSPPPAPQEDNPYVNLMQQYKDASAQAASGVVKANTDANPDQSARAQELSNQLGIPSAVIEHDLPTFEARAQAIKNNAVIAQNPVLASWVATNQEAARAAQDDFEKLGAIEKTVTALKSGFDSALTQDALGRAYNTKQAADALGVNAPQTDREIQQLETAASQQVELPGVYRGVQHVTSFVGSLIDNVLSAMPEMVGGAGLGFASGAAPGAAIGAVAGLGIGFKTDMARVAAGLNYRQTQFIKDRQGAPLSNEARQVGALVTGLLTYTIAGLGQNAASKESSEVVSHWTSEAVTQALQRPTVATAIGTMSRAVFHAGVTGAAMNAMMEGSNILGEELAKQISHGDFETVFNDPATRQQAVSRLADAAETGALLFGTMGALGHSVGLAGDLIRARQAGLDAKMLQQLQDGAGDSATLGRSRSTFLDFLKRQTDGSPVENLYLPAESVLKLYQSAKIDPNAARANDALFGWVKDMPAQLQQAAQHGGDVVIPTADYITHLSGSELGKHLLNDVRVRPDAMSLNEAQKFQETYQEQLKQHQPETGELTGQDKVYQDVQQQAVAAGLPASAAHQYAALFAARYGARGARLGIDPFEAYQRSNVEIARGDVPRGIKKPGGIEVERNPTLTPEEQQVEGRFAEDLERDPEGMKARYREANTDAHGVLTIATDNARDLSADYAANTESKSKWANAVHEPASSLVKSVYSDVLKQTPPPGHDPRIVFMGGGTGAGKTSAAQNIPLVSKAIARAQAIYDSNLSGFGSSKKKIDQALAAGKTVNIVYVHRDAIQAMIDPGGGSLVRAEKSGRTVPISSHAETHEKSLDTIHQLVEHYKDDPRVSFNVIDNNGGKGKAKVIGIEELPKQTYNNLATRLHEEADKLYEAGKISERVYRGTKGTEPEGIRGSDRPGTGGQPEPQRIGREPGRPGAPADETRVTEFSQPERGSIAFEHGKALIELFKGRDLSTLLHESGHLWLEELRADALDPNAPPGLKDDLQTVLKWFGADSADQIKTEHHEQFARAAEAYLMEGKAPSEGLRAAFQRFRQWLTHIYRTVAGLQVPISDEMRQVFDRLLATDDEITAAQKSLGVFADQAQRNFRDKLSGLMTKAEFDAYAKAIDRASTQANETLLDKMMARVRKERTSEWKAERARMVDEVSPEIDARPAMQALANSPKLDPKLIDKLYDGNEAMKAFIPKSLLAKTGGLDPTRAGDMFGYASGDEFLKAMIGMQQEKLRLDAATGKEKSIRQHAIDQEVDKRMNAKYGDLLSDDSIREEALEAVHNRAQEEALATELKVIGRSANQPGIPLDLAREWAAHTIAGKTVAEVAAVSRYARAEARAAKEAQLALLGDKPQEAYLHKRQQILNHLLYREAQQALKDIDKGEKLFKRYAGEKVFKGLDQDYTDRIHELLDRFGYRTARGQDELGRGLGPDTLETFARNKFDQGYELAIDPSLFNTHLKGPTDKLTVEQFRALKDAVTSLAAVGREENTIHVGDEKINLDSAITDLRASLDALPQRKPSDWYRPEDAGALKKLKARTMALLRLGDASLLKEERMLDWFDANDPKGPFNKYVFRPLKEAQLKADDLRRSVAGQLRDIMKGMPKEWVKGLDDEIPNVPLTNLKTGQPFRFTRKQLISMALNFGNADNAAKLAAGYGWSEGVVKQFLNDHMRKNDWDFAQHMFDMVGQFRGDIDALQRRVTGVGIDFVKARPIDTPHGQYAGGYFPIVYDALRSYEAERHMAKAAADMFENQYYRATTPKGFTIKRVEGVKRPISLDLDVIPWKIGQVIHDLSFREAIMNAGKILSDKRVAEGIDNTFGHEYTQTLRPWLQSIANSRNVNDQALSFLDPLLRWARTNATYVGIGFRVSTMYKHGTTALSNSIGELGIKWMRAGIKESFGTPQQMKRAYDLVLEKSGEMRNRLDHYDRDIRENLKTLLGESGLKAEAQRYSTYGVGYLDMMSAVPTWLGAYRKALSEGETEADSVYLADKMVRKAHGSQGLVDLASIQRGGELQKLLTMFYGFFNHIYNQQRDTVRTARLAAGKVASGDYAGAKRDFPIILARTITYLLIPAMVEAIYTSGGPNQKKGEGWGEWAGKAIAAEIPAGIPVVRDLAKSALEGHDYEMSPVERAAKTMKGTFFDDLPAALGVKEQNVSKKWLRHAIETAGYVTGWPTGQLGQSAQFLWDVDNGTQQPDDLTEWFRGLSFGKAKGKE